MSEEIAVPILPAISGHPMSLNTQIKAFKHAFEAGAPSGILAAFDRAEMALRQTDIPEGALKANAPMPAATLPDIQGRPVALAGLSAPWSGRSELLSSLRCNLTDEPT